MHEHRARTMRSHGHSKKAYDRTKKKPRVPTIAWYEWSLGGKKKFNSHETYDRTKTEKGPNDRLKGQTPNMLVRYLKAREIGSKARKRRHTIVQGEKEPYTIA